MHLCAAVDGQEAVDSSYVFSSSQILDFYDI